MPSASFAFAPAVRGSEGGGYSGAPLPSGEAAEGQLHRAATSLPTASNARRLATDARYAEEDGSEGEGEEEEEEPEDERPEVDIDGPSAT